MAIEDMSFAPGGIGVLELEPHGFVRSDSKTPFSLASCSKVIGMNEPELLTLADSHLVFTTISQCHDSSRKRSRLISTEMETIYDSNSLV